MGGEGTVILPLPIRAYKLMRERGTRRNSLVFAAITTFKTLYNEEDHRYFGTWPDPEAHVVEGGERNGIEESRVIDDWWVAYSPRNGRGAQAEGPWGDWVVLAGEILREEDRRRDERRWAQ